METPADSESDANTRGACRSREQNITRGREEMHDARNINEGNGKRAVYPILLSVSGAAILLLAALAGAWATDVRDIQIRHDERIGVLEKAEARNDAQHEAIRNQLDRIEALLRESAKR